MPWAARRGVELGVTDLSAAKVFYGNAFGWTSNDYGPGPAYVVSETSAQPKALRWVAVASTTR